MLQDVDAGDVDWSRVQNGYARDFSDLQTALTALGYQGQSEPNDRGMSVTIIDQNRPQRPALIESAIREEIAQRQELLTARETQVLENHLQAEVAALIQRFLLEADRRVVGINAELAKRHAARAHCMALVREFDLDFFMTSEREWACYAALPGVSICQLQRHEGIDAVYVSRWNWDGRTRLPEADGARRFPGLPDALAQE